MDANLTQRSIKLCKLLSNKDNHLIIKGNK